MLRKIMPYLFSKDGAKKHPDVVSASFLGNIVSISPGKFLGGYSKSDNGVWAICWMDSYRHPDVTIGGHRDSGHGQYILFSIPENKICVHSHDLERPNNGHVSDNGIFVLEDWHFGSSLSGTFWVLSNDGGVLIRQHVDVNMYTSGISPDGAVAYFSAGGIMYVFDVQAQKLLFSAPSILNFDDGFERSDCEDFLFFVSEEFGKFKYSKSGEFTDISQYKNAQLMSDQYWSVISAAEWLMENEHSKEVCEKIIKRIDDFLDNHRDKIDGNYASIIRTRGNAYEALGDIAGALKDYRLAVDLYPKIGLKRKIKSLEKLEV